MRKRFAWALGIALFGLGAAVLFRLWPAASLAYQSVLRGFAYPQMSALFARTGLPVGEFLLAGLAFAGSYRLIACLLSRRIGAYLSGAALVLSIVFGIYAAIWTPLYGAARAEAPEYDGAALYALSLELIERTNELAGLYEAPQAAPAVAEANALMGGGAKLARYPEWMTALSIAGIYLPWTFEALVNPAEPAWTLPFTACHELAHARGVAGELEANLIAYFSCLSAGGAFEYSAQLCMLRYALGELRLRDEAAWQTAVNRLSAAAQADFTSIGGFAPYAEAGWLSDLVLRLSGDARGASSYTAVLGALIALEAKTLQP